MLYTLNRSTPWILGHFVALIVIAHTIFHWQILSTISMGQPEPVYVPVALGASPFSLSVIIDCTNKLVHLNANPSIKLPQSGKGMHGTRLNRSVAHPLDRRVPIRWNSDNIKLPPNGACLNCFLFQKRKRLHLLVSMHLFRFYRCHRKGSCKNQARRMYYEPCQAYSARQCCYDI